nr:MAG TPA: hypothetical protein [Caudoviricetes sp.]
MKKDLTGQRFGRLTVVASAPPSERYPHKKMWHCRCDCGREADFPTVRLTTGQTKSCGCIRSDSWDITGQRHGSLTAIRPTDKVLITRSNPVGRPIWVWRCDCGREIEEPSNANGRLYCDACASAIRTQTAREVHKKTEYLNVNKTRLSNLTQKISRNNTSGVKGVYQDKASGKWVARIKFQRKTYSLGRFERLEDAAAARKKAEAELFKPVLDENKDVYSPVKVPKSKAHRTVSPSAIVPRDENPDVHFSHKTLKQNVKCICIDCGATFYAGSSTAKRCGACKTELFRQYARIKKRKKNGWTEEEIALGHRIKK